MLEIRETNHRNKEINMTKLHVNQQRLGDKMSRNIVLCGREIHNPIHTTEWHYVADDPDFYRSTHPNVCKSCLRAFDREASE